MKELVAKLALKFFENEIINLIMEEGNKQAKQEAIKKGYAEEDWMEYQKDRQGDRDREIFEAGVDKGLNMADKVRER